MSVNGDGVVCAVIAAAKASTANAFSLPGGPLSTGNLFAATQPSAPIFRLETGNPVDTAVAYRGDADDYGSSSDPLVGAKVGGTIVFGGGLPLDDRSGALIGGVGVSDDSSCADHIIAWEMRSQLDLDAQPAASAPNGDNITMGPGAHPDCAGARRR